MPKNKFNILDMLKTGISGAGGFVGDPELDIPDGDISFGNVAANVNTDATLQLDNIGSNILTVTGITLPANMSIVSQSFPFSILPNASKVLTVRCNGVFNPDGNDDQLAIASNDPINPSYEITVSAKIYNLLMTFSGVDASPIANPLTSDLGDTLGVVQLDGTWAINDELDFTAQATVAQADLSIFSSHSIPVASGAVMAIVTNIRQITTLGSSLMGVFASQTVNFSSIMGITMNASPTIRALVNGGGLANPYGFATTDDIILITLFDGTFAWQYAKIGGYWRFLWRVLDASASHYLGLNNDSAVGYYGVLLVLPTYPSNYAPAVHLAGSQAAGTTFTCADHDSLIKFTLTTRNSAGTIEIFICQQDASNYYQLDISSAGAINLYSVIAGSKSASLKSGSGIVSGDVIGISIQGSRIQVNRGTTTLISAYFMANFLTATGGKINSLGTGGVISEISVDSFLCATQGALGADVVSNGTFATDTVWTKGTNWSIAAGVASKSTGTASNLTQNCLTMNTYYEITFTVSGFSAGNVTLSVGGDTSHTIAANGTYTFRAIAHGVTLGFNASSTFVGSIDNVSAKPIPLTSNALGNALDNLYDY